VIKLKIIYFVPYWREEKTMTKSNVSQDSMKIYIDKALKLKFKSLCALQDKDMSQIASGLIDEWVRQNETPSPQQ
jgi:hypothetical protein